MIIRIIIVLLFLIVLYALFILICSFDTNTENADYILVLGHELYNDKPNDVLKYRLRKALEYYDEYKPQIILSGGITKDNTISEASYMFDYLTKNGVPCTDIKCEDKSTNTIENIKNCIDLIEKNKKVLLISSNYHIFRSKMICRLYGLKVKGLGVYTPLLKLFKHLCIEEVFIFIHYFKIKNNIKS